MTPPSMTPPSSSSTLLFWGFCLCLLSGVFILACLLFYGLLGHKNRRQNGSELWVNPPPPAPPKSTLWDRFKKKGRALRAYCGYIPRNEIGNSFQLALQYLRQWLGPRECLYSLPWVMVLGEQGSGKTSLLESLHLPKPSEIPPHVESYAPCGWRFFNHGVVLELSGKLLVDTSSPDNQQEAWRFILYLLANYRILRPLDGLVLTLSAADLLGATPQVLGEKYEKIFKKLVELGKILGVKLPVYVIVTHTDVIGGFRDFCYEISEDNRDDIFGWSCPHVDGGFHPGLVDKAFDDIHARLLYLQQEIFYEGQSGIEGDGLVVFPSEIQRLRDPLKLCLDTLLSPRTPSHDVFFRGIYFTGDGQFKNDNGYTVRDFVSSEEEGGASPYVTIFERSGESQAVQELIRHPKKNVFFSSALFRDKIFVERGLAVLTKNGLLDRLNLARWAQMLFAGLVLAASFGLMRASQNLRDKKYILAPAINQLGFAIQTSVSSSAPTHLNQGEIERRVRLVTRTTRTFRENSLASIFIPASWVSLVSRDLQTILGIAYDALIVRTIGYKIDQRIKDLLEPDGLSDKALKSQDLRANPLNDPHFKVLKNYIDDLESLKNLTKKYYILRRTANIQYFKELIQEVFGVSFSETFYKENDDLLRSAIFRSNFQSVSMASYKAQATAAFQTLAEKFLRHSMVLKNVFSDISTLQKAFDDLPLASKGAKLKHLRHLSEVLEKVSQSFQGPEALWIKKTSFVPGKLFADMIEKLERSPFIERKALKDFKQDIQKSFKAFKIHLKKVKASGIGFLFNVDDLSTPHVFSKNLLMIQKFLKIFLSEKFSSADVKPKFQATYLSRDAMIWNYVKLGELSDVVAKFQNFQANHWGLIPQKLRSPLQRMFRLSLKQALMAKLGQAQQVKKRSAQIYKEVTEDYYLEEVQNLRMVLPQLKKAIEILHQVQASQELADLRKMLTKQSLFLLGRIDAAHEGDKPYAFSSDAVSGWKGSLTQIFQAFGTESLPDLKYKFSIQRDRLIYLAREYMEPLIRVLETTQTSPLRLSPLFTKWHGILVQLDGYATQQPNSLEELETFVLETLGSLTLSNCPIALMKIPQEPLNYFTKKIKKIRRALSINCLQANRRLAQDAYRKIVVFFDEKLKGKYPFVAPGIQAPDVPVEDLRVFFRLFDAQALYAFEMLFRMDRRNPAVNDAIVFLNRLKKLKAFFKPFVEKAGDVSQVPPSIPFEITFRTNQSREQYGNHLMNWDIDVSGLTYGNAQKAEGRWVYNTPIRVRFRWALGSPYRPVDDKNSPHLKVDALHAVYQYEGPWALMKFLQAHQTTPGDFDGGQDPLPDTLCFKIPMDVKDRVRATAFPADVPQATAPLFTRVFVSIKGSVPFALPTIPFFAPSSELGVTKTGVCRPSAGSGKP